MEKRQTRLQLSSKRLQKFPSLNRLVSKPSRYKSMANFPNLSTSRSPNKLANNSPPSSYRGGLTQRSLKSVRSSKSLSQVNLSKRLIINAKSCLKPSFPMSPQQAIAAYPEFLTTFEKEEILGYSQVYYLGIPKKKFNDFKSEEYNVVINDHIHYRFEVLSVLGKGSFGQVCKCMDHMNKQLVALKVINKSKKLKAQAKIEAKILQTIKDNDPDGSANIVRMISAFKFRGHICVTFEVLGLDLFEFIKLHKFRGFNLKAVRKICKGILTSLCFLRKNSIIHCDIKPENILLLNSKNLGVKLIDFGSSCFENSTVFTYIQSRFYRAPEIMLEIPYSCAIDMWSFGCVAVELHKGFPLFPGRNEKEQMLRIMEVIGVPSIELLRLAKRASFFFDQFEPIISPDSKGKVRFPYSKDFAEALHTSDPLFVDFIKSILVWNPNTRPTPEEALNHPWITNK